MNDDPELLALTAVYGAIKDLDRDSQQRVIDYVSRKLGLAQTMAAARPSLGESQTALDPELADYRQLPNDTLSGDTDGISPIAIKWMRRSGLTPDELGHLFSLGTSEIDLVAKAVPGKSKNARTRSVTLLKGLAAYLSSGAARITDEQIKEACLHYDAFDSPNHAKYLKAMSPELTGSKANGFTLTARGLTAGTDLIKELLGKV